MNVKGVLVIPEHKEGRKRVSYRRERCILLDVDWQSWPNAGTFVMIGGPRAGHVVRDSLEHFVAHVSLMELYTTRWVDDGDFELEPDSSLPRKARQKVLKELAGEDEPDMEEQQ